ncbi:MAG: methyltransferase domain-containing protein [Patescibacteria group bacterium]
MYEKGEKKHYTKLLLGSDKTTIEKLSVLALTNWKGKTVLDIGSGGGEVAYLIAKKGAKFVTGIDYSPKAVETAQASYSAKNLKYEVADVTRFTGTYDIVLSMGMLEHMDNPFAVVEKFSELTRPKGSIIITVPNWANGRGSMLLMLRMLFGAKITLADLHFFTPRIFMEWAKKLGMKLSWKTVDFDWAQGEKLIQDFNLRLPKVLLGESFKTTEGNIRKFNEWLGLEKEFIADAKRSGGAVGLYHLKKGK